MRRCTSVLSALLLGAQATLAAQGAPPLVSDRPDFTESALTIPRGMLQLEAGATVDKAGNVRSLTAGEVLARIGTGSRTELRIGLPSWRSTRDAPGMEGFDNAFLGAKVALSTSASQPIALLVGTALPTGARAVATRTFQPEAVLAMSFALSDAASLTFNAGVARPDDGAGSYTQRLASASLGLPLGGTFAWYLEVYDLDATGRIGTDGSYADGGITWGVTPTLQLDARFGSGLGSVSEQRFAGVGIVKRFTLR